MSHWSTPLLSLPWEAGGRGPTTYDCWGLLVKVYRERLSIELPEYNTIDPTNLGVCSREISLQASSMWTQIEKPVPLCAVGLSRSIKFLHHVGIYIPEDSGLILHCHEESGVIIQSEQELRHQGWRRIEFYGHRI